MWLGGQGGGGAASSPLAKRGVRLRPGQRCTGPSVGLALRAPRPTPPAPGLLGAPTADTPPGLRPASSPASGPVGLGSPREPWGHKSGRGWAARLPGPPEEGAGCVDRGHAPALPPPGRPGAPRAGGLRTWALRPPPARIPGRCAGPRGLTPARGTARVRAEGGGRGLRLTLALADDLQEPACCLQS